MSGARRVDARHLVLRFARSIAARRPAACDVRWGEGHLTPAEQALLARLPAHDQRHAIDGARAVASATGDRPDAVEAALVHDVGKWHARLGIVGRSAATAVGWVVRDEPRRRAWADTRGWRGRVGRYLRHDVIGADDVAAAGGSALAVAWTAAHHDPPRFAALPAPPAVVEALDTADRRF